MSADGWSIGGRSRARADLGAARTEVLRSATAYVESTGLTLGIDATLIARLAADAGISVAQFEQIWSTPNDFLADLFYDLAIQAQIDRADTLTLLSTWELLSTRTDELSTAAGRRRVLVDVIRTAAEYNFDAVTTSSKWSTYAALSTTIRSWPESEDRARVLDALSASEVSFVETMESFYRNVLPTIGYRLKPAFHDDFQPFVVAAASVIEGLGIVRSTVPVLVEAHFDIPVDTSTERWSVAAIAFMAVVDAFIEPEPDFRPADGISRLNGGIDVTPGSGDESNDGSDFF